GLHFLEAVMRKQTGRRMTMGVALVLCASSLSQEARAQGFFFNLFGSFGARPSSPPVTLPFGGDRPRPAARPRMAYGGGQTWCVRSCDGRYFPIAGPDDQSKAQSCNNFCPASKTELVYGSDIDHAATSAGKPYSELPNAFRYRNETVAGCTCNG